VSSGPAEAQGGSFFRGYDAFGRVTQTAFPSSLVEMYAYDAAGNLTSKTDRKGQTIEYVYHALKSLREVIDLLRKRNTIAIFIAFVAGYLIAAWICFTKSELITPTAATCRWRQMSEILAFPMVYFQPQSSESLLALMLLNSVIWSALLTVIVLFLYGQMRRHSQVGR
jgi:YD repeat-containing protein